MIITRVEDKEVIGFVRTGDAISDEHVLLMKGRLVVSNSVAAYSSTNIDTAPVWSFGKCLRVSGFLLSFVLYKKVVWEEIEWLAREHPGCSDYVLRATAAMQGDFLAVPEAVLVRSMQPYEYYGEVEAQKALFEIAYSCRTCRARLFMPPLPGEEVVRSVNATPSVRKCCGQL